MSGKIVQLNEEIIKGQLKELVRGSVEETLNELLEAEAEKLTQAARYERNVLAPGDHDHILSGVFNQFLSATPRASRINKKSANNPALID